MKIKSDFGLIRRIIDLARQNEDKSYEEIYLKALDSHNNIWRESTDKFDE